MCKIRFLFIGYDSHFLKCNDIRYNCEICNEECGPLIELNIHKERAHMANFNNIDTPKIF